MSPPHRTQRYSKTTSKTRTWETTPLHASQIHNAPHPYTTLRQHATPTSPPNTQQNPARPTAHNPTPTGEARGSQLILPRLLLLATTAPDEPAQPRCAGDSDTCRRRVWLAVDLDLGLTRAPLVLRDPGEGVRDVLAASAPRLLCCDGGPSVSAGNSKDPYQVRVMGCKAYSTLDMWLQNTSCQAGSGVLYIRGLVWLFLLWIALSLACCRVWVL